jgi:hypothetical protein
LISFKTSGSSSTTMIFSDIRLRAARQALAGRRV